MPPRPLAPTTPASFTRLVSTQARAFGITQPEDLAALTLHTLGVCLALALQDAPKGTPPGVTMINVCQSLTDTERTKE